MNCTIHYQIDFYCYHRQGHCKIYNKETTFIEFICRKSHFGDWLLNATNQQIQILLSKFISTNINGIANQLQIIDIAIVKLFLQNVVIFFLFRLNVIILDIFLFAQIFISEIQKINNKVQTTTSFSSISRNNNQSTRSLCHVLTPICTR